MDEKQQKKETTKKDNNTTKESLAKILEGAGLAISAISNANVDQVKTVAGNLDSDHPVLSKILGACDTQFSESAYHEHNHHDTHTYHEGP
ncbi:hypothetical protein [Sorangium sp. So ce1335]|uniref:hypothetical protein n=1 Tax=Sorangium sp. So ce1335 TaxID=3133335 RepID=UPI003F5D9F6C